MLIGLLMIFVPIIFFMATLPFSRCLTPGFCMLYRIVGVVVVFAGGGTSVYLAAYTGDQGGIGAYFLQLIVISVYLVFSVLLVILNWLLGKPKIEKTG